MPDVINVDDKPVVVEEEKSEEGRVKALKEKLDNAYSARDEAIKKLEAYEKKLKAQEIEKMKAEGKEKELQELQAKEQSELLKATQDKLMESERRIDELSKERLLQNLLSDFEFKNAKAKSMAYLELSQQVHKSDKGEWVGPNKEDPKVLVKLFMESEDNSFLLKPKINTGSGSARPDSSLVAPQITSLFDHTQEEVMRMAAEGKLPNRKGRK